MKVKFFNDKAKAVEKEFEYNFGDLTTNDDLISQYIRVYRHNQRQFGAKTKDRSEVKLTGKKVYKQKGTGRARHGAKSAPIFVGGGVAHGPQGIKTSKRLNKKQSKKVFAMAILDKINKGSLAAFDIKLEKPSTKEFTSYFGNLDVEEKKVLILTDKNINVLNSVNNIDYIKTEDAMTASSYAIFNSKTVLLSKDAYQKILSRLN